ncbi:MAG: SAM-dependent chlorinase/fluorinase [Candidatus Eremiobacterota bacterium]
MKKICFLTLCIVLLTSLIVQARPLVVLTTDFGLNNEAVGLCHGAILAINPDIEVVDLCHNVKAFDVKGAAMILKGTECFPPGTVFVSVIDPGVGTDRGAIAIKTKKGLYYIAPNNGLLTFVIEEQGLEAVYELDTKKVNPQWNRGTFDGRDLFSPAGAILAANNGKMDSIGHEIKQEAIVMFMVLQAKIHEGTISGVYVQEDEPFGNAWTNITEEDLKKISVKPGDKLHITAAGLEIDLPIVVTFGEVKKGEPLAYMNSEGTLAFAINQGNFTLTYNLKEGMEISVKKASGK